jgi:hypothetical protein
MFGLLRRSVRRPPASPSRARPLLERLEARDCPVGPVVVGVPSITLNVAYGTSHNLILTGTVTDNLPDADGVLPASLTVSFGGIVNGAVNTDANGNFKATLHADNPGKITASFTDLFNRTASTDVTLNNTGPVIADFKGVAGAGNIWTFTGHVADDQAVAGLVVSFADSAPLSLRTETEVVTVQADGSFALTIQMNQNLSDCGTAAAQVFDWWGTASNVALANVQQNV